MKKKVSILLLMLVDMLILTHAVVPHHHHNKMFVAIVNVLDDDVQNLFNHEHGHSHHHDGSSHHHHGDMEDCLMSEAEAVAVRKIQPDDSNVRILLTTDNGGLILFAAIGLYKSSYIPFYSEDDVKRQPYAVRGHADFVVCAKGLRAPPVC